jgi:hypothetical protein
MKISSLFVTPWARVNIQFSIYWSEPKKPSRKNAVSTVGLCQPTGGNVITHYSVDDVFKDAFNLICVCRARLMNVNQLFWISVLWFKLLLDELHLRVECKWSWKCVQEQICTYFMVRMREHSRMVWRGGRRNYPVLSNAKMDFFPPRMAQLFPKRDQPPYVQLGILCAPFYVPLSDGNGMRHSVSEKRRNHDLLLLALFAWKVRKRKVDGKLFD